MQDVSKLVEFLRLTESRARCSSQLVFSISHTLLACLVLSCGQPRATRIFGYFLPWNQKFASAKKATLALEYK